MATQEFTTEQLNNEIWKPIKEYAGIYSVSNLGRVRREPSFCNKKPRFIKGHITDYGYHRVGFCVNKITVKFLVHRLVGFAFLGEPTAEQTDINHKDGNKLNNLPDNLEWCSRGENARHAFKYLPRKGVKGEHNNCAKLKDSDIPIIRQLLKEGISQAKIGRRFNVSQRAIWQISSGKKWTHI